MNEEKKIRYAAKVEGRTWSAGRMIDVDDVIAIFDTREEAQAACDMYEMPEGSHLTTYIEEV